MVVVVFVVLGRFMVSEAGREVGDDGCFLESSLCRVPVRKEGDDISFVLSWRYIGRRASRRPVMKILMIEDDDV